MKRVFALLVALTSCGEPDAIDTGQVTDVGNPGIDASVADASTPDVPILDATTQDGSARDVPTMDSATPDASTSAFVSGETMPYYEVTGKRSGLLART